MIFYSVNDYFKHRYGRKIVKLSLDGGFTCPNRDGKLDTRGCLFCSDRGSGEYAGIVTDGFYMAETQPILEQMAYQKSLLSDKWRDCGYLGYFQNFSNTYAPLEKLIETYAPVYEDSSVVGLALATRPDCITDEMYPLFKSYMARGEFWLELGLQSIHPQSVSLIRRHYDMALFESVYSRLKAEEISVVLHIILGLPGETREMMLETVKYVSSLKPFGVKFHMLNVLRGSDLEAYYAKENFKLLEVHEYIDLICDALELLPADITIHRLTGDGPRELLIAPMWIRNKRAVLNGIQREMRRRGTVQGAKSEV